MKSHLISNLIFVGIFLFYSYAYPTAIEYHAKEITIEDGLLSNHVNNIYQDKDGFIWFGTENGLSKYDGINYTHFQYNPLEENCLSSNIVNDVIDAGRDCIYVGTNNGLNSIESQSKIVRNLPLIKDSVEIEIVVNDLYWDGQEILWIGTNKGLYLYNTVLKEYLSNPLNIQDEVYTLCADENHNLWIGTKKGIFSVSLESSEVGDNVVVKHPTIGNYAYVNCIRSISAGIWISTNNSNYIRSYSGDEFYKVIVVEESANQELRDIKTVYVDENNTLWIGSGAGLYFIDQYMKEVSKVNSDKYLTLKVQKYSDYCCIDDISGGSNNNIWVSHGKTGVIFLYQSHIKTFKAYNNLYGDDLTNYYTSISINNQNDIYAGTGGDGLYYFDTDRRTYSRLNFDNQLFKDVDIVVTSTCMDASNTLWFGTYNKSLFSYTKERGLVDYSNKIVSPKHDDDLPIKAIVEFGNKLLIGSNGNGLYVYDKNNQTIKNFNLENSDLSSDYISCIYVDRSNRIWIGTYWGLNLFDLRTERCRKFLFDKNKSSSIGNNLINSINEDQNGSLWISTSYGLNKFNEDFSFTTLVEGNGLPSNYISSVVAGHNQELWVATKKGLCALNLLDHRLKKYKLIDSEKIIEFDENVWNKGWSGNIYLGSNIGIIQFDPSKIKDFPQDKEVKINDIKVLNKSLLANRNLLEWLEGEYHLRIKHAQKVITFEYTALNYIDPSNDEFEYMMEGFDVDWQKVGKKRTATYTNLSPGEYKFRVKLTNHIASDEAIVNIKILPPLWQKWYAYVFYLLVIIAFLAIFKRYSIIGLKLKHDLLTKEMDRQKEMEKNEMKFRFFTNISHEFRTPLTLIISPLEKLTEENKDNPVFNVILNNAKRMQRLINQLLEFRMIESDVLKLNLKNGDVISAVHKISNVFNYLAEEKNIRYSFKTNVDSYIIAFDYDKIEKIIYNLVSNAFKHTPSNGEVNVLVNKTQEGIQLIIEDSGVGIPQEELPNVFDLFYSLPMQKISKPLGSGVGLSLTKKLVELHGGNIKVESEPNIGTMFTVNLPQKLVEEAIENEQKGIDVSKDIENYIKEDFGINETEKLDLFIEYSGKEPLGTVMIVEDNDEIRMFLSNLLQSKYKVVEASDGKEGLVKAKKYNPDLVVADIMMPVMNGIEFCKRLKKDPKTNYIPVIIITAYHEKQFAVDALKSGAIDFVEKPFDPQLLLSKVENIVCNQAKLSEKYRKKSLIQPSVVNESAIDQAFLKNALEIIEDNLLDNKISVELLAKEIGITQISLYRKLKKYSNMTPVEFIKIVKVKKAGKYIKNDPELTINEVAYMVGFNDVQYFRKCFKKEFGVNPSEYKKGL